SAKRSRAFLNSSEQPFLGVYFITDQTAFSIIHPNYLLVTDVLKNMQSLYKYISNSVVILIVLNQGYFSRTLLRNA
ncbi:MAG: hypothetical protein ACPGP0_09960, partial [Paracoccaceae bacterium]